MLTKVCSIHALASTPHNRNLGRAQTPCKSLSSLAGTFCTDWPLVVSQSWTCKVSVSKRDPLSEGPAHCEAQICRFPQYATQTVLSCPCHAHVAACVGTANLLSMSHKYITPHLTSPPMGLCGCRGCYYASLHLQVLCRTQILQSRNSSAAEPHQKLEKCTRNCIVSGFNDIHPLSYLYICIYNLCIYVYIYTQIIIIIIIIISLLLCFFIFILML